MMDELCKRDLLKDNLYSWIETSKFGHGKERLGDYTFSCFDDKKMMLDEFEYETNREFTTNIFDMKCFVNVVTEKTYRQLFIGQPFLTLCAKDTHKTLKGYGFELYDEIFDYSFDSESDYKDRIKGIIDNVERLKGKDYSELYRLIEDKVEHNVRVCYELISKITGQLPPSLSHYPPLVRDF
jgi:hypothetical protein